MRIGLRFGRSLVALLIVVWMGGMPLRADEKPADSATPSNSASPADPAISRLILQLASDSFEAREKATRELMEAGGKAVEPLAAAALKGESLEVTCRAVRILQAIYAEGDDDTFDRVESALNQLVNSLNPQAARRAAEALRSRQATRQERAIARIIELGGSVDLEQLPNGVQRGPNGEPLIKVVKLLSHWKGGDAGLEQVKRLTLSPTQLPPPLYVIRGAKVSQEALDAFSKERPQFRIEHRGPILGVSDSPLSGRGCEIGLVTEDSPADKAGLQSGDIIVKYDGRDVKRFTDVVELNLSKVAGDKVKVEIIRRDETGTKEQKLVKEVILGEWK